MTAMTCPEAEPLLPLVADGAVDPSTDPDLFAHLAACPSCQRIVADHDLIALALRRSAPPAPPRARIITFPRLAAAALVLIAIGVAAIALAAPATAPAAHGLAVHPAEHAPAPAPVAVAPAAPARAPVAAAIPEAAAPTVLRLARTDGSTVFLIRRGDAWVAIDPTQMDGSSTRGQSSANEVPVRW